jgi:hypothetical protein
MLNKLRSKTWLSLVVAFAMVVLVGGTAFAASPAAAAPPNEVLLTLPDYQAYSFDVTQSYYVDAYTQFALGVLTSGAYISTTFPVGFDPDDIVWTDNTPGTLGTVATLAYYGAFSHTFPAGPGTAYEAYFSTDYSAAPDTGPYSVKATYTADPQLPEADFSFVVTDEDNTDPINVSVGNVTYEFYDDNGNYWDSGTFTVYANDYYSLSHIGRSYVTAMDGIARSQSAGLINGYTTYGAYADAIESITLDTKITNSGLNGWQYRVYKPSGSGYVIDNLSEVIAMDDYKLSSGDYVLVKYGDLYDTSLFPATLP